MVVGEYQKLPTAHDARSEVFNITRNSGRAPELDEWCGKGSTLRKSTGDLCGNMTARSRYDKGVSDTVRQLFSGQ